jgi:hypothetical protein
MFCVWAVWGETVTDLSQLLLAHHGVLRGLFRMDIAELARLRGLGDAKSVRLKAALELGRRLAALSPEERLPVGSPEDVANLLATEMAALEQEQLRVVLLDTMHRILGTRTVYQGSVNQKRESTGNRARQPKQPALKRVAGWSYRSRGDPTWLTRPRSITTIRSESAIASALGRNRARGPDGDPAPAGIRRAGGSQLPLTRKEASRCPMSDNALRARGRNPSTPTRRPSIAMTIGMSATTTPVASVTTTNTGPRGTRMPTITPR